jgi:hypothetical protein
VVRKGKQAHLATVLEVVLLDQVLNLLLGVGLELFLPATPEEAGDISHALLRLVADQCKIGMAASLFLSGRLNVVILSDPYHRLWNDVQDALKAMGLWGADLRMWSLHRL